MSNVQTWIEKAEEFEKKAKQYREFARITKEGIDSIKIGSVIKDLEINKLMKVSKLKNGSNDFEAVSMDDGIGRGYHYIVRNWVVI